MKTTNSKKLALALTGALGLGSAGHAAADVYGLSYLEVDNLQVFFGDISTNPPTPALGGADAFTFSTSAVATLDGVPGVDGGIRQCSGDSTSNDCGAAPVILSTPVQNAGGSTLLRPEDDYTTFFGTTGNYSNSESIIISAALIDGSPTHVAGISESNLQSGEDAGANTSVGSNTTLSLTFEIPDDNPENPGTPYAGAFLISFTAALELLAEVTPPDLGTPGNLSQVSSSLSVVLTQEIEGSEETDLIVSWAPTGRDFVQECYDETFTACVATEEGSTLNTNRSSSGAPSSLSGGGTYSLLVTGLTSGTFNLALTSTTFTDLNRVPEVPVPGTLFLMGAGLLIGARSLQRKS